MSVIVCVCVSVLVCFKCMVVCGIFLFRYVCVWFVRVCECNCGCIRV